MLALNLVLLMFVATNAVIFPSTWNNVHTFLAYDMYIPSDISDVSLINFYIKQMNLSLTKDKISLNYDFVWGASPSRVSEFRFGNPKIILSSYIPFNRDPNSSRSLDYWRYTHPDWILYQCDQKTPVRLKDDPNIGLDISNPEVVAWQVHEYAVEASRAGFNMLAVDNVHFENFFGACGVWKDGHTWIQLYSGAYVDESFRNDTIHWLNEMQTALSSLTPPLGMVVDYRPDFTTVTRASISADRTEILKVVDAVVDGGGFTNFGDSFVNESVWIETIRFMMATQEQHKAFFSINQFSAVAPNVLNWILASYLMGKGKSAYVYITTIDSTSGKPHFGSMQWYYEYGAQIGNPVSSLYKSAGSIYRRDFSNGLVLVNHGNASTVILPSLFYTLHGDPVVNVTLDPRSGIVLLKSYIIRDPAGMPVPRSSSPHLVQSFAILLFLSFIFFFM